VAWLRFASPDTILQLVAVSDGILEMMDQDSLAEKEACLLNWVEQEQLTVENLDNLLSIQANKEIPDDITLLTLTRTE